MLQPVKDQTVVSHGKVTFVLSAFFVVSLRPKVHSCYLCLPKQKSAWTEGKVHSLTSRKGFKEIAKVMWPNRPNYIQFHNTCFFIHGFSWDFSSNHTQMNFHQFTYPRRGWCEMVAKTCCCIDLFSPVLFWWWDNSLQLDLWCEQFLQSSLCYSPCWLNYLHTYGNLMTYECMERSKIGFQSLE